MTPLPSAAIATAEHLAAIAKAEGITLAGDRGQVLPELAAVLYLIRVRCEQVQNLVEEVPASTITPSEIATVLETISQVMVSEGIKELAGYNASWYKDAAAIDEQINPKPEDV